MTKTQKDNHCKRWDMLNEWLNTIRRMFDKPARDKIENPYRVKE